ncbi:hypothetical protein HNP55_003580 [Paucibacter oligotrophus]|uniref:Uncharacterized protein n=1 Tax=Roseateles oligotrophus TaxID=1769250 RepID=A0A840L8X5_9BURK|nr:discoidin domain-containing protein [Roseateles oligotrophus]MBB4845034.1 hypothetical protein [Roseateles oligotrophus]
MGAYRYWRVNLLTGNPNGRTWLRDLELRGVPGGPDLTVPGGTFTVNSQDVTEVGLRAIDGDPATAWNSGSPGPAGRVAEGTYDFGVPTVVAEVALLFGSIEYTGPLAGSWVSASNDLQQWTVFGPTFGAGQGLVGNTLSAVALTVESPLTPAIRAAGRSARLPTSWPAGGPGRARYGQARYGFDVGPYRIAGTVFIDGTPDVPVSRRVRLFDRQSARMVREGWSDPVTGAYAFENLPAAPDGYFVLSHDHTGVFNAEVKDRIQPIP